MAEEKEFNIKTITLIPAQEQEQCLQTGIWELSKNYEFLGAVLQCMNINYTYHLPVPTAGVHFDNDQKKWIMGIHPEFFCRKLNADQRVAILLHEMSHITNKHPIRVPFLKIAPDKRMWMNIAADLAINQYIKNLPKGCQQCPSTDERMIGVPCTNKMCPGHAMLVEDFYDMDDKGNRKPWPKNQTMEFYYEKLIQRAKDLNYDSSNQDSDGEGDGKPKEFDSHNWGEGGEESDMLDATEELVKRAMIKSSMEYDELPGSVKELLEDIESRRSELNYKALILQAIKRSATGADRKHTYSRKSKRFGCYAPGTKDGDLPKLDMYIDSSGSISIQEGNEFLDIVDNFLKAGSRKCNLNLFHTRNYYRKPYKLKARLDNRDWESGGTCLEDSMRTIAQTRPDLAIILTDGYYGDVEVEKWLPNGVKFSQCLFIISRDGTVDHPLKRLGNTIKIPDTAVLSADQDLENI